MPPEQSELEPNANRGELKPDAKPLVVPLYAEEVDVSRRKVERAVVRIATVTHAHEQQIEEELTHERVEIVRVPIGRTVEAVPPTREEGDTTILAVVEEVLVVERRLVLKEEVRIRRVRTKEPHTETVVLRKQEAVVTRTDAGARSAADSAEPIGSALQPRTQDETS